MAAIDFVNVLNELLKSVTTCPIDFVTTCPAVKTASFGILTNVCFVG